MYEIIPNLYLGTVHTVENVEQLKEKNVKALVACCTKWELPQENVPTGFEFFQVEVEDMGVEYISSYFKVVNEFIDYFIYRNMGVLIFCCHGISRSPTIAMAYLIESKQLSLNEAFNLIMEKKQISPNFGFMDQLCQYEKLLRKEISFCQKKYMHWFISERSDNNVTENFST